MTVVWGENDRNEVKVRVVMQIQYVPQRLMYLRLGPQGNHVQVGLLESDCTLKVVMSSMD